MRLDPHEAAHLLHEMRSDYTESPESTAVADAVIEHLRIIAGRRKPARIHAPAQTAQNAVPVHRAEDLEQKPKKLGRPPLPPEQRKKKKRYARIIGTCKKCGKTAEIEARGLCKSCYHLEPDIRAHVLEYARKRYRRMNPKKERKGAGTNA